MRLTLATDTFLPEVNGVTTVLAAMRDGLRARGHSVQVLAPAYPDTADDEPEILRAPSMRCPGYSAVRLSWPMPGWFDRAIARFDPDIVHAVTEGPLGWMGRRYAKRTDRVLVTSFHTDFPRYAARYLGSWSVEPVRGYLRWFHSPAAVTQTPSEVTRDELHALGLPRAVTWGCAADPALFTPARRDEHRRRALGAESKVLVLHVGRLAIEKDMDTLIAALRAVHATAGHAAAICVAGDGPEGERVRRELPFAHHLGFLNRAMLADLYADADLFLCPSPTETCGLVVLEAMASGLPVIGADQGGVQENIQDGRTGRRVRSGDADAFARAVIELVYDAPRRQAMSEAARAFATGRDWARELDRLIEQYEAVTRA
jgi:phosphatidylinositol alpha 1,6-mannosyltransferase